MDRSSSPRPDVTDKFDVNDNVNYITHSRNMSQASNISDSGIGAVGTVIYDAYDDDDMLREAMESPQMPAMDPHGMHQKRPSLELDLDGKDARRTQPNTPEPQNETPRGDYVLGATSQRHHHHNTNGQSSHHSATNSGTKKRVVDMSPINTEFNGARPSRTPTPVADADAEILVEETSGCSCFGWFGRKKKKVGLAQQELR